MKGEKLPKMNKAEILQLIREQSLCRIAFGGDPYPHISPFQYVVINEALYFHFTDYGKKIDFLKKDNAVSIEIEKFPQDLSKFAFVTLQGNLKPVDDSQEKNAALEKFASEGKKNFSENFLIAHGFPSGSTWDDLAQEPLTIVKLDKVVKMTGLKSTNYEN
jgi:uncharacterized protein